MNIELKQISSLEKIRNIGDIEKCTPIGNKMLLGGETFSFQHILSTDSAVEIKVGINSPIADCVRVYELKNTVMDYPCDPTVSDDDYITKVPGIMPDLLVPIEDTDGYVRTNTAFAMFWIEVRIPYGFEAGEYNISLEYVCESENETKSVGESITVEVLGADLPKQRIKVTQWFHGDCIADMYNVPIYSEEHWELLEKYMREAHSQGMNMILTPVVSPPLDTKPGKTRPDTQLVGIEKKEDTYEFDFSLLKRWIDTAHRSGMEYFEISHLFSQWGGEFCPNIYVTENGEKKHMFGWHVSAKDDAYREFLSQFLPKLTEFLEAEGVSENTYFHITDEPSVKDIESYKYDLELVKPLIGNMKIMDAMSDFDFYERGLITVPVTATDHIRPFLNADIGEQWVYYCCGQAKGVANRFFAMPSYRNRILGIQLYKYGIKGFLQWGFNFWYAAKSLYKINPYVTTSSAAAFPSGDPFSVYPGQSGPMASLRGKVFREAIQEVSLFELLESLTSRNYVIALAEKTAECEITFSEYPRNSVFSPKLNDLAKAKIKELM